MRGMDDDIAPLTAAPTQPAIPSNPNPATEPKENQKLGILAALLAINDWEDAEGMLHRLAKIDPPSHPAVLFFWLKFPNIFI